MAHSTRCTLQLVGVIAIVLCLVGVSFAVEYAELDQSNNNLQRKWGMSGEPLLEEMSVRSWKDARGDQMWEGPSARQVSTTVVTSHPDPNPNPNTATSTINDAHVYFGQFIAHDFVDSLYTNPLDPAPIPVPTGDAWFDPFNVGGKKLDFFRGTFTRDANGTRQFANRATSFIDASPIYASNVDTMNRLRNATHPARMAVSYADNGEIMPPLGIPGIQMSSSAVGSPQSELFQSADPRTNVNVGVVCFTTLLLREHNRLVDELTPLHPEWDSETMFQEARRRVIATLQSIVYYEYLPVTVGRPLRPYSGYKPHINPAISNFFASAAFRYGHSELNSAVLRINAEGELTTPILTRESVFRTSVYARDGCDDVFRGLLVQPQLEVDTAIVDELHHMLFGFAGSPGSDLVATNIQRGRDHGVAFYNDARAFYGLPRLTSFSQITNNTKVVERLAAVYSDVDHIDPYIGGLAEDHVGFSSVGPLFAAAALRQYDRSRDADRFYFENPDAGWTPEEINHFKEESLSKLILRNTALAATPCDAFFASNHICTINSTGTTSTNGTSFFDDRIVISWTLSEEQIDFVIEFRQSSGWVGFGLASSAGSMLNSDVWLGYIVNGQPVVIDGDISGRSACSGSSGVCADSQVGGVDDLFDVSGVLGNGGVTYRFSRKLVTGDSLDIDIVSGKANDVIIAYSGADTPSYHGPNKIAAQINFFTGSSAIVAIAVDDEIQERLTTHGVMMFIGWGVLFPFGIFVARFLKDVPYLLQWWFHLHLLVQYTGVLFLITGFALGIEGVAAQGHDHFTTSHTRLGLATFILGIFVPAFGQLTAMFWSGTSSKSMFSICGIRIVPEGVHYVTGYLSPIVAFVTLYYGLHEHKSEWYWYLLLSLWLGFVILAFLICFTIQLIRALMSSDSELDEGEEDKKENEASWSNDG